MLSLTSSNRIVTRVLVNTTRVATAVPFSRSTSTWLNDISTQLLVFPSILLPLHAPRYYIELRQNTIPRFSHVANVSFGISALVYFAIGAFGYYTFGDNTNGFILNNYSTKDELATLCRFAIAIALIFTYPLPFIGTRDAILDLFSVSDEKQTSTHLNLLSVALLSVLTLLAVHLTDLGFVNAVGGAALGTGVVFVFPSIMFYSAVKELGKDAGFWLQCESFAGLGLMLLGISMGVLGIVVVTAGIDQH